MLPLSKKCLILLSMSVLRESLLKEYLKLPHYIIIYHFIISKMWVY